MHEKKRWLLRIALATEVLLFAITFFFDSHGMRALYALQAETVVLRNEIDTLGSEVAVLEHDIAQWHEDVFYKEKMAREQLQMARCDEIIYYIE